MEQTIDLERRRRGIGGTDISAILGMNPWRGPFDVWLDKTGQGTGITETPAMRWGKRLEPAVAQEFADNHPELGVMEMNCKTFANVTVPFLIGTPDALFYNDGHGLEVKTAGFNRGEWGESGSQDVPRHYLLQCIWYMAVMDWDVWHIAVLIGGNDYREYEFHRDLAIEATLISKAQDFWETYVVPETSPPVDGTKASTEFIKAKYPTSSEEMLTAVTEQEDLFVSIAATRQLIKERTVELDELENRMKFEIGGAAGMSCGLFGSVTWKRSKDGKKTDWRKVATDAEATPEQIASHTEVREGSRRFLVKVTG